MDAPDLFSTLTGATESISKGLSSLTSTSHPPLTRLDEAVATQNTRHGLWVKLELQGKYPPGVDELLGDAADRLGVPGPPGGEWKPSRRDTAGEFGVLRPEDIFETSAAISAGSRVKLVVLTYTTPGLSTGTAADHDQAPVSGRNLSDRGPAPSPHKVSDSSRPARNLPACADSGCLNQMASFEPSGLPRTCKR
jgi:hypothetical protein